jgi:hypothetical protein
LLEQLLCIALLALIPGLVFLNDTLRHRVPLSLQSALFMPPWEEIQPKGVEAPQYPSAILDTQRYYPWFRFLHDSAERREWPLWSPNEGCGVPFFAVWRTRALSPFTIPFYLFPLATAFRLSIFLKLIVAGWGAYFVGRRFRLAPAMALFLGAAYQWAGPISASPMQPMADVMPWFPLLMLCTERLMLGGTWTWPWTALVIGLMAFGGDPETLVAALLFMLAYMVARRLLDRRWTHLRAGIAGMITALLFGLALAAVQILPYIEFVNQGDLRELTPPGILHLSDLVALLAPNALTADRANVLKTFRLIHPGVIPLLLFPVWCAARRFVSKWLRRRMEAILVASLLLLLTPLLASQYLARIPLLNLLRPEHFLIIHGFVLAFLAASAMQHWNTLGAVQIASTLRRLLVYLPLLWALAFIATAWLVHDRHLLWRDHLPVPVLGAAAILMLLFGTLLRPSVRGTGYALALISCFTLFLAWYAPQRSTRETWVFPRTAFIKALEQHPARIAGGEALRDWPFAANDIAQAQSPSGIDLRRMHGFLERAQTDPSLMRRVGAPWLVLTKEDVRESYSPFRPRLVVEQVFPSGAMLFRDLDAHPRAFMLYKGRRTPRFDPRQLNAKLPPLIEDAVLPEQDAGPEAAVVIDPNECPGEITLHTENTRPGIVVLADAWYPGWNAWDNDKPAEVRPIDGAFRGVEVGQGKHTVVFRFEPATVHTGLYITAAAFVCIVLGILRILIRRPSWSFIS